MLFGGCGTKVNNLTNNMQSYPQFTTFVPVFGQMVQILIQ